MHQGSALSPLPFIRIMDVLQVEIGKEPPWEMLSAEVELQLERRRETFASHGRRVSRGKTEYMPCPEKDQTFNYLHSGKRSEDREDVQVSGLIV